MQWERMGECKTAKEAKRLKNVGLRDVGEIPKKGDNLWSTTFWGVGDVYRNAKVTCY